MKNIKSIKRAAKGILVTWEDTSPEKDSLELDNWSISHKNPVYRLATMEFWRAHKEAVINRLSLKWAIKLTVNSIRAGKRSGMIWWSLPVLSGCVT